MYPVAMKAIASSAKQIVGNFGVVGGLVTQLSSRTSVPRSVWSGPSQERSSTFSPQIAGAIRAVAGIVDVQTL
jgi:hypothetical protein